jgi:prophage antirepressor-like protein
MSNVGIVYLIQPAELVETNRFKVGCSSKNTIDRCVDGYRKGTRTIYIIECIDPFGVEKILKSSFNTRFKLIAGKEYFEGDEVAIKKLFIDIVFADKVLDTSEVVDNVQTNYIDYTPLFELFEFTEEPKDKITNNDLQAYIKHNKVNFQYKQVKILLKTKGCNDYTDNYGKFKSRGLNGLKKVKTQEDNKELVVDTNEKRQDENAKIIINVASNDNILDSINTLSNNYILFEKSVISIIVDLNNVLWFNARDLTLALKYTEAKRMIQLHIAQKDKIQLKNINHDCDIKNHPQSIYINESGLYTLLIKSNKPTAKKFTAWITGDVLPSIRKYGYYKIKTNYETDKTGLLQQINYLHPQTTEI